MLHVSLCFWCAVLSSSNFAKALAAYYCLSGQSLRSIIMVVISLNVCGAFFMAISPWQLKTKCQTRLARDNTSKLHIFELRLYLVITWSAHTFTAVSSDPVISADQHAHINFLLGSSIVITACACRGTLCKHKCIQFPAIVGIQTCCLLLVVTLPACFFNSHAAAQNTSWYPSGTSDWSMILA